MDPRAPFCEDRWTGPPGLRLDSPVDLEEYEWEKQARGYDDTEGERVCLDCIVDTQLRANLSSRLEGVGEPCVGCGRYGSNLVGEDVLREMLRAVHLIYGDALNFMPVDGGSFVFETTDGRDVMDWEFADALKEDAYMALREYIREDVSLARDIDESDALSEWWRRLRQALAKPSPSATGLALDKQFLDAFEGLLTRNGSLLRTDRAGTRYWRVRELAKGTSLRDYDGARHMGSPPTRLASDNRFSRNGQSAFYGATAVSTSISEVFQGRPGTAVKASFVATRSLTLLDLVDLPASPSIYDKNQTELYLVLRFLRQFASDVSRPVVKTAIGHYAPTQEVTDVVRRLTSPVVDGIRYTSSQDGLPSVVIFAEPRECADPSMITATTMLVYEPASLAAAPAR